MLSTTCVDEDDDDDDFGRQEDLAGCNDDTENDVSAEPVDMICEIGFLWV